MNITALVRDLPDADSARLFYERLAVEHPRAARLLGRDEGLLADALALAAWSPLLATTLAQHPDYLSWLARERQSARVRTDDELGESLARFALTNSQLETQVLLARFRRRELLRIYLHDLRRTATLVEITEELSNLADAVLQYALKQAQQELDNLYGSPQCTDARGRLANASFSIVALGKLGSRELNYASDIDLLFLYSDDGTTTGTGTRGSITNREYFGKLAERISRLAGQPSGEGAAYRVDLRLRPHGRDGALSCSLAEALRYYRTTAQDWELQVLIRARVAAGSATLYARFAAEIRARVYRTDTTVAHALAQVRLAKQKIDRQHHTDAAMGNGFNVKLGRGGIREIEFIAQALQLAHGGRDGWLRAPHTLISLGRLHDRGYLNEREHTALSDAYAFLRTLEHRVQMEHGLQTHLVPADPIRRMLVARRMNFEGETALAEFDQALHLSTTHVRAAYERVFGTTTETISEVRASEQAGAAGQADESVAASLTAAPVATSESASKAILHDPAWRPAEASSAINMHAGAENAPPVSQTTQETPHANLTHELPAEAEMSLALTAAALLAPRVAFFDRVTKDEKRSEREKEAGTKIGDGSKPPGADKIHALASFLHDRLRTSLNARRALSLVTRVAASLDKSDVPLELTPEHLAALIEMCDASEYFGEMLASNPLLIPALTAATRAVLLERDYGALLRAAIHREQSFGGELSALRRTWAHLLVELGACDARREISLRESNQLQTALAAASINAGYLIASRELARRYGPLAAVPRLAVLGLGRLGSSGTDYGSDLDIVLIYDEAVPSPIATLTREEAYARFSEIIVTALSSLTRDGYLYRVDLRLRPDGKNGAVAISTPSFVSYLRERAHVWEWLAYVKLRAVAGDLELGKLIEEEARRTIHEAAGRAGAETLRLETRSVRERLEHERTRLHARQIDIKFGAGGMLDVYFATRYLQLRDAIPDAGDDRSTRATLARLHTAGSLDQKDYQALDEGYSLLRALDHDLRIIAGRSTRLPALDHPALGDLAHRAGYAAPAALIADLTTHMQAIRAAYHRIMTLTVI